MNVLKCLLQVVIFESGNFNDGFLDYFMAEVTLRWYEVYMYRPHTEQRLDTNAAIRHRCVETW